MRLSGISSIRRRAYKATTNSNHSHPIAPNLLMRNFIFEHPDQAWVEDITYIPTGKGWLYLALAALDMAYRRRRPAKGLIFHSNRACSTRPEHVPQGRPI